MYNAKVLLVPKPPTEKYIFYRSICDALTNQPDASRHNLNNLISKIESISTQVIQHINASRPAGSLLQPEGSEAKALADKLTESLDDLDLISFIIHNTSLEQQVFDRNGNDEQVFKSDEYQTLYKYYFDLVSKLSHSQSINHM